MGILFSSRENKKKKNLQRERENNLYQGADDDLIVGGLGELASSLKRLVLVNVSVTSSSDLPALESNLRSGRRWTRGHYCCFSLSLRIEMTTAKSASACKHHVVYK